MKIMKQFHTIMYLLYNVLLFSIVAILLISIVIIAATNSWYYLFLFLPVLLYIYKREAINYKKKKYTRTGKKS